MASEATAANPATRTGTSSCPRTFMAGILLVTLLTTMVVFSGCTSPAKDPVIGTWEWSDGKGYTERYTFNPDHSFSAMALGSEFNGTWTINSPDRYEVLYTNRNDTSHNETMREQVHYDSKTDAIYFPAHRRVA